MRFMHTLKNCELLATGLPVARDFGMPMQAGPKFSNDIWPARQVRRVNYHCQFLEIENGEPFISHIANCEARPFAANAAVLDSTVRHLIWAPS